jgi:hypothetical protein
LRNRELLAGLFAARLVDAHVGRSAPAAHQLAPFADRHAHDAVAAVLLVKTAERYGYWLATPEETLRSVFLFSSSCRSRQLSALAQVPGSCYADCCEHFSGSRFEHLVSSSWTVRSAALALTGFRLSSRPRDRASRADANLGSIWQQFAVLLRHRIVDARQFFGG